MKYPTIFSLWVVAMAVAASGAHAQVKEFRMIESGGPIGDSIEQGYIKP